MKTPSRKVVIVGGVAGGASCAARLRRDDEAASIIVLEKGPYVSFANCGLPYHVGGIIPSIADLVLATPEKFASQFNIDVRTGHEVTAIDPVARTVSVRQADTEFSMPYDDLVLSPGAVPVKPPLPGIDLPGIYTVRNIPDVRAITEWIATHQARSAVVVGGGFIGLEMAENLLHAGLHTTVVEMLPQVMPPFDPEMTRPLENHLREKGIHLALGDGVAGFSSRPVGGLWVATQSGTKHEADIVILAIGVRPDTTLAKSAGLELGPRGGIKVNSSMRTSDAHIYAVGDAVEVVDQASGEPMLLALAGPANRQGRIAADAITGRPARFRGVQGTSICGVFDYAIGMTGASEKALKRRGQKFAKVYLFPKNHVAYYPGAEPIFLKLLYAPTDGRILGAQAVGKVDIARKIDTLAMAIQMGATVADLAEAELAYSPQFGAAKDAINLAGMIALNALRGDTVIAHWEDLPADATLIDVRDPDEFADGHHPLARNIPLSQLRQHLSEIPTGPLYVTCAVGQRGHNATRILRQHGHDARNLSGGWNLGRMLFS